MAACFRQRGPRSKELIEFRLRVSV